MANENERKKGGSLALKILAYIVQVCLMAIMAVLLLVEPTGTAAYTAGVVALKLVCFSAAILIGKLISII